MVAFLMDLCHELLKCTFIIQKKRKIRWVSFKIFKPNYALDFVMARGLCSTSEAKLKIQ
jgi:hypothetical protein